MRNRGVGEVGRGVLLVACLVWMTLGGVSCRSRERHFDGERALKHVEALCDFGPRPVGSEANAKTADYITAALERDGWRVEQQRFAYRGESLCNVIGRRGQGPVVLLGTHYDTRPLADRDPVDRSQPILGANDGGSGVGLLLELARVLDERAMEDMEIWLVFFDGEDRGDIDGWPWSVGADYLVGTLTRQTRDRPEYAIILDMIGDAEQDIYYEWSSSLWLQEMIWGVAADLGYGAYFVPRHRYHIVDDHTAFLQWGMAAALVIDFDYPYWHTSQDTPDKLSTQSLQRVGDVMETLLEEELSVTGSVEGLGSS